MSYKLKIDPRVSERYPEYTGLIIYAYGLVNKPGDEYSMRVLREAERRQRAAFADEKPAMHPHIAAWRRTYESFGRRATPISCWIASRLTRLTS